MIPLRGRPKKDDKKVSKSIRIDRTKWNNIKEYAVDNKRKIISCLEESIVEYLTKRGK